MWTALLAGMGGLLPTLSRIGASFAAQPEQALPHWHIIIPLAIFFVLGFILNFPFNRDGDFTKAVIIGIAAPGLITNIIAGVSTAPLSVPSICRLVQPLAPEIRERLRFSPSLSLRGAGNAAGLFSQISPIAPLPRTLTYDKHEQYHLAPQYQVT